ncbi:hypothetical protein Vi05172_g7198 [Venturia inaequalis]|nr:hypothetical protein Vi05172_g7198 [Venturia inaequalis]
MQGRSLVAPQLHRTTTYILCAFTTRYEATVGGDLVHRSGSLDSAPGQRNDSPNPST